MELLYNKNMLVSHETPISFLDQSRSYNDFDYALVHLFETHPEYYSFFKSSLLLGREVLLDNSIFELKEAFDSDRYAKYIEELKPTYFIVPDVLEDAAATVNSYLSFREKYSHLPGMWIGAVQGKNYDQIVECYRVMSGFADYIAISFDFSWYQEIGLSQSADPNLRKLERMCDGRQKLIQMLIKDGIWNHKKPHHLLGCSLAKEFAAYKDIPSIRSCDTSNPVVAGIVGKTYIKDIGLREKPSVLLADLIDQQLDSRQQHDIWYNVNEFKAIVGR
jgi:hypothetical protein